MRFLFTYLFLSNLYTACCRWTRVSHDFLFPLFSGVYFQGTTIGMAPIMSMCTAEQSGGIVMVSDSCQSFLMTARCIDIFEHFQFIFTLVQFFTLFNSMSAVIFEQSWLIWNQRIYLYCGISKSQTVRLQLVQNTVSRLLKCPKHEHITPILRSLHCLWFIRE